MSWQKNGKNACLTEVNSWNTRVITTSLGVGMWDWGDPNAYKNRGFKIKNISVLNKRKLVIQ